MKSCYIIFLSLLFGQQALGAQAIYKGKNAYLRDVVEKNNCIWRSPALIKKEYPELQPIIDSIDSVHFLFAAQIEYKMTQLKYCLTERTLPRFPYNNSDDLYIFTNSSYIQPAISDGGVVFIDTKILKDMPPIHQGFTVLHEVVGDLYYEVIGDYTSKDQTHGKPNPLLHQVILNLHAHYLEPVDFQTMELIIKMGEFHKANRLLLGHLDQSKYFDLLAGQKPLFELEKARGYLERNALTPNGIWPAKSIPSPEYHKKWYEVVEAFKNYVEIMEANKDREALNKLRASGLLDGPYARGSYYTYSWNMLNDEFNEFAKGKNFKELEKKLTEYSDKGLIEERSIRRIISRFLKDRLPELSFKEILAAKKAGYFYGKYAALTRIRDELSKESSSLQGEELKAFVELARFVKILDGRLLMDYPVRWENSKKYFPDEFLRSSQNRVCAILQENKWSSLSTYRGHIDKLNRILQFLPEAKSTRCDNSKIIPYVLSRKAGSVWAQFVLSKTEDVDLLNFDPVNALMNFFRRTDTTEEEKQACARKQFACENRKSSRSKRQQNTVPLSLIYVTHGELMFIDDSAQLVRFLVGQLSPEQKNSFRTHYFDYLDGLDLGHSKVEKEASRQFKRQMRKRVRNLTKT